MTFTERSPIERGFSVAYHERLVPQILKKEQERLKHTAKIKKTCWLMFGAGLLASILTFLMSVAGNDVFLGLALFFICAAILGPLVYWRIKSDRWSLSVASVIMPSICEHLGTLTYAVEPDRAFPTFQMEALGVVPSFDKPELSHWISGTYRNTEFELVQAALISKGAQGGNSGRRQVDRFNGLLLHITTPEEAPGQILITKDQGNLGRGLGKLWSQVTDDPKQQVQFGHDAFEKAFDVFASDPQGARTYLSDATLDNLLAIAKAEDPHFGPKLVTAGFRARSFYLAIRRERKFLQMSSITQSLEDCEELVHSAFAEIETVHGIIDQLLYRHS